KFKIFPGVPSPAGAEHKRLGFRREKFQFRFVFPWQAKVWYCQGLNWSGNTKGNWELRKVPTRLRAPSGAKVLSPLGAKRHRNGNWNWDKNGEKGGRGMVNPRNRELKPPIHRGWLRLRLGRAYYTGRRYLLWCSPRYRWAKTRL